MGVVAQPDQSVHDATMIGRPRVRSCFSAVLLISILNLAIALEIGEYLGDGAGGFVAPQRVSAP